MFTMLDRLYSIPSTLPHVTRRPPLPPSKSRLHIPSFPLANRPELLLIYHDTNQRGGLKRGGVAPLAIFIAASTNHTLILYGNNDINRGGRVGMGGVRGTYRGMVGRGGTDESFIPTSFIIVGGSFRGGLGGMVNTTSSGARRRVMAQSGTDLTLYVLLKRSEEEDI